ncbi:hypothetical protein VNO78_21066 [Psophocarpus tetragonolobus]|uniref:Uncharacterized protein n=1 Tax=Psophocarpus tetragonolobus TaxID=3891 RepID=A0AAN9SFW1_PSOTE
MANPLMAVAFSYNFLAKHDNFTYCSFRVPINSCFGLLQFISEVHLEACRRQRLYYIGDYNYVKNHIFWGRLRLNPFHYLSLLI